MHSADPARSTLQVRSSWPQGKEETVREVSQTVSHLAPMGSRGDGVDRSHLTLNEQTRAHVRSVAGVTEPIGDPAC